MDLGVSYAQGALNAYPRPEGQNAIPGMIKFDDVTLMTSDLVRVLGRQFVGLGVVAPDAFVKITK